MESFNKYFKEYKVQLSKGIIQKAYREIIKFMSYLKTDLEKNYPNFVVSSLYLGYLDMTYFAFTPSDLKNKKLKIAIVFLHEQCRFEAWLGGSNRKIQSEYISKLRHKKIGDYKLSKALPGVDSIIESILVEQPDFNHQEELRIQIEEKTIRFINDISSLLAE